MKAVVSVDHHGDSIVLWMDGDELVMQADRRGEIEFVERLDAEATEDLRELLNSASFERQDEA